MDEDLDALRLFNGKVARLESTAFMRRYGQSEPEVVAQVHQFEVEQTGPQSFDLICTMESHLRDFDQDEIDAFVLTYRMFTQKNDRISLWALARIYDREWMPAEAAARFAEARQVVNDYLDSATTIMHDGGHIGRRDLVDIVINGGLAHAEPAKQRWFDYWAGDPGIGAFTWAEFVVTLVAMVRYLAYFRDLNARVLANCAGRSE